jgi:hypothetical protein
MSTANTALLYNLALEGFTVADDLQAGAAGTQGGANRLPSQLNRCTLAAANGSFILPAILSGDAAWIVFLVNDSGNTNKVFPAIGENLNGTLNASLSIPAGQSGIFVPVPNGKGGTIDWRSSAIP